MIKKSFFLISFVFLLTIYGYAEIKVVSPSAGMWANKQTLIIDTSKSDNDEFYYSVDGSSPKEFGFAYDGPVFLDTTGNITLKIARVSQKSSQNVIEEKEIIFNVTPDKAENKPYSNFISSFYDNSILSTVAGSILDIPEQLYYKFDVSETFLQGKELTLSSDCVIERYIPCTVWNKESNTLWHFVIQTVPQSIGIYSKRDVPFYITDWNKITFTNKDFIYRIDSEYWSLPKEPVYLDRSVSHMISWQNLAFEEGNPVEFFVLPPKPELNIQQKSEGEIIFTLEGDDSYKIGILSKDKEITQLYDNICLDTFYGDKLEGVVQLDVYSNSIYQGSFTEEYSIDKCPPNAPVIKASTNNFYSRKSVKLQISGEKNADLFVAISKPLEVEELNKVYDEYDSYFDSAVMGDFKKIKGNYEITLSPDAEAAQFYKILAFTKNDMYQSSVSEYKVIIDLYNYYFDSTSTAENSDGTAQNPYNNLSQCINVINKTRSVCLRVKGDFVLPEEKTTLKANCVIRNAGNAELIFPAGSTLVVKNSSLEIDNCRIRNDRNNSNKNTYVRNNSTESLSPIIKMENGVLSLNDCQISANYTKNGTLIEATSSVLNFDKVIASVNCNSYSSFVSGIKTRINLKDSIIAANGATSVILSLNNCVLSATDNSLKVAGQKGRIAELFGTEAYVMKNKFIAELTVQTENSKAIYTDKNSKLVQSNNDSEGF